MEQLKNIPELLNFINLLSTEENIEHLKKLKRMQNASNPVDKGAKYLSELPEFIKFEHNTFLKASYFILYENEIILENLAYGCDNINDFERRSFDFIYSTNNYNLQDAQL